MKLRFTPRATQDIISIADYIGVRNPAAALSVRASILDSLQALFLFPKAGHLQTLANVRKIVSRRYGYLIYYTHNETAGEIIVLGIKHAAQNRDEADA